MTIILEEQEAATAQWITSLSHNEKFDFSSLIDDTDDHTRRLFVEMIGEDVKISDYIAENKKKLTAIAYSNSEGSFGYDPNDIFDIKVDVIGHSINDLYPKFVYIKNPTMWISGNAEEEDSEYCDWSIKFTIVIVNLRQLFEHAVSETALGSFIKDGINSLIDEHS